MRGQLVVSKTNDPYLLSRKVLLVLQKRIRTDQDLISIAFSGIQQVAIPFRPSFFICGRYIVDISDACGGSGVPWSNRTRIYAGAKALRAA